MKRCLIVLLLLGLLLLSTGCSTSPISQDEEPQDGQYYTWEYVLSKAEAKVYFYGAKNPTILYAIELAYTSGGILSVRGYFTHIPTKFRDPYLYSDELRTFGGSWEVREVS